MVEQRKQLHIQFRQSKRNGDAGDNTDIKVVDDNKDNAETTQTTLCAVPLNQAR